MELMNQPFSGQLGNRLVELLNTPGYQKLNVAVAFAKNSGVLRIKDPLQSFRDNGGEVNVCVGVDLGGTSYEALTTLLQNTDSLSVVHSERGQTFHVKIYQFVGAGKGYAVVGSHNLTAGGLWTNVESSVHVSHEATVCKGSSIFEDVDAYFAHLKTLGKSYMPIAGQDDIEKLLEEGYLVREVVQRLRSASSSNAKKDRERIFGSGFPASLPLGPKPEASVIQPTAAEPVAEIEIPSSDRGDTIWFETRKMTGGSRNILDLSMKSLIESGDPKGTSFDLGDPKFMRGAVEFFGLNPTATNQSKDIKVNFEGVDYVGNTVLFPDGEKANGTWRLQIKGVDPSKRKITDAFKSKGEETYLVHKIVTFTRVQDDHYYLSVFPETELDDFKSASRILARNGSSRNAKLLGLL